MEQTTLKYLRMLIPGIIVYLIGQSFYSIFTKVDFKDFNFGDIKIPLIVAISLGAIYYVTDIRFLVTNYTHKRIDLNIKNHIVNLYNGNLTNTQRQYLFQNNRLKQIFYKIVDNDQSLSVKKNNVYFNGLLWTTFADIFIITLFGAIVILICTFFGDHQKSELRVFCFTLLLISIISLLFHVLAFFKHVKLSNDQIEFIETNHINTVKENIEKTLRENNVV